MPGHGPVESWEHKGEAIVECFGRFTELWNERVNAEPGSDLISMLAHGRATRNMDRAEYHGQRGPADRRRQRHDAQHHLRQRSTRSTRIPDQYDKLRANPDLIPSMVSETIRWQTPLAHMRRTATQDVEFGGKTIKKGDKVVDVVRLGQPRRER